MLALAMALILFGYTVAYAGAQNYSASAGGFSLLSAFNCQTGPSPVNEGASRPGSSTPGQNIQPFAPAIPGTQIQPPSSVIGPGSGPLGIFPGPLSPGVLSPQGVSQIGIPVIGSVVRIGAGVVGSIARGAQQVLGNIWSGMQTKIFPGPFG